MKSGWANGSPMSGRGSRNGSGRRALPDLHGRPVPTLPHLVAFRDRLLDQIAASGVRVINATGGGILHGRGLEVATLDDVFAGASPVGDLRARDS